MAQPIRIAMWSGPRNISTAMMRAWGNRDDTVVVDEPLYAFYLQATGIQHPDAEEVIATGETDWRKVVAHLAEPIQNGKRICFQKQMTHHLLPEIDRDWLGAVTNCFLIREPGEVINSYIKKREDPALEDLGFVQQAEIFDFVRTKSMLSWPPGLRDTDGIWARYWYGEVAKTTSFQPYRPTASEVPARLREIHQQCCECYERLYEYRLH